MWYHFCYHHAANYNRKYLIINDMHGEGIEPPTYWV